MRSRHSTGSSKARAALVLVVLSLGLSGCFFRKNKGSSGPQYPTAPIRLALLPLNAPEPADQRWLSLALVALIAKEAEAAPDLELLPAWQSLPVAVESLGSSRSVTDEVAAFVATRTSSRWAAYGEIKPAKEGIELLIDFIPSKPTLVAYRYRKQTRIEDLSARVREAFSQFLRYLIARPLPEAKHGGLAIDQAQLKVIADALDREHGWFQTAEPGKAAGAFSALTRSDDKLAKLLFNPGVYQPAPARPAAPQNAATPAAPPPAAALPAPQPQGGAPASPAPAPEVVEPRAPAPAPASTRPPAESPLPETSRPTAPSTESPPAAREYAAPAKAPPIGTQAVDPVLGASASRTTLIPPARLRPAPAPPAEPKPAPPPPPPSPPPATRPEPVRPAAAKSGYRIQVFSTRRKAEAESKSAELERAGYRARLETAELGEKGIWYRVRLEGFPSREEAATAGKTLQSRGVIGDFWVVP